MALHFLLGISFEFKVLARFPGAMRVWPRTPRLHPLCQLPTVPIFNNTSKAQQSQNQAAFELPPNEREPLNLTGRAHARSAQIPWDFPKSRTSFIGEPSRHRTLSVEGVNVDVVDSCLARLAINEVIRCALAQCDAQNSAWEGLSSNSISNSPLGSGVPLRH